MSDHSTAFVPIESWCYASPELIADGTIIDMGLLADALIYYDKVLINITTQHQFASFLSWFQSQGRVSDLYALVADGTLTFYDYAFFTAAVVNDGGSTFSLMHVQDPIMDQPDTFQQRVLYHEAVKARVPKAREARRLYEALRGRVIEVKAEAFSSALREARRDSTDPRRQALVVQAFVDEVYRYRKLGRPPQVEATVIQNADGASHRITWSISFAAVSQLAGEAVGFRLSAPLSATALATRFLWSASEHGCDLYLPTPMSRLVGDKLFESGRAIDKTGAVIEDLQAKVEFPDIRQLVNDGRLGLGDVLEIRSKAARFRQWLQTEAERDRDAIIAYHNEVAKETGLVASARRALSLFGVLGGGAIGGAVGSVIAGPPGGALGGAAGGAVGYVADVVAKLGADWRPVVFGAWLRDRIKALLEEHERTHSG